jgi:hypothetical protein
MLDGSWAHPDQIVSAASWESDFETISLDEVKAEAKQYLAPEPLIVVASPATQASAAPVKPKG